MEYGYLPPVRVSTLAFGTIPVSANISITQTATNGYLDPIKIKFLTIGDLNYGPSPWPGFGPVTEAQGTFGQIILNILTTIDASVNVRLSDVVIDGRKVDVGDKCSTEKPAHLRFAPPTGYADGSADLKRGTPGSFFPNRSEAQGPPGWIDGAIDIPGFAHCTDGRDDISKVISNLVSAPDNLVSAYVPYEAINTKLDWCALPIAHCSPSESAGQLRMAALAAAIAQGRDPASIRRLGAAIKPLDTVLPKVKAPDNFGK